MLLSGQLHPHPERDNERTMPEDVFNTEYSVEGSSDDALTDDSSTSEAKVEEKKEQFVPESRFKEVYGKMKELERDLSTLREGKKEGTLTEDQQAELKAKEYLKGLLKETLAEEKSNASQAESQELEKFKSEVSEALSIHSDVKKDDFLSFLEKEGDDYSSVESAMRGYKRLLEKEKDGTEKAKKDLSKKPSLPSSEGSGYNPNKFPDDKGKSLWQIAQEAAAEFSKK